MHLPKRTSWGRNGFSKTLGRSIPGATATDDDSPCPFHKRMLGESQFESITKVLRWPLKCLASCDGRPLKVARFGKEPILFCTLIRLRALVVVEMLFQRRELLASAAWFVAGLAIARASAIHGRLPWHPSAGHPPAPVRPGPWLFFTSDEAAAAEAVADRIIPPDPQTPGGRDAGCGVYLDRQLAGPYGRNEGLYNAG